MVWVKPGGDAFWGARTQLRRPGLDEVRRTTMDAPAPAVAFSSQRVAGHLREYEQLEPFRREPVAVAFEARLREVPPRQISGLTGPGRRPGS